MDENMTNEAVVEEAPAAEGTFDEGISDEEFDAMWDSDDDDGGFVEQDVAEEADQPEAQPETEEPTEPAEPEAKAEDADQYLELKHLDEVKKVSKEEAKVLAQKGMDYDRIRQRADADSAKVKMYEDFFNEIKGDFATIPDMMIDTLARVRSEKQGKTYEEVKAELTAKQQEQQKPQAPSREEVVEQMRRESLSTFLKEYPDVKPDSIPKEVWDDMKVTNNLVASYAKYEAKKLAEENKVLKQNATNKARSTGSMKSSGKSQRDEFDTMWYDDDY